MLPQQTSAALVSGTLAAPGGALDPMAHLRDLIQYYTETGADYEAWSPNFNMHFGYFGRGISPLDLESMLKRMSLEVLHRVTPQQGDCLLDAGCGLGAVARDGAAAYPHCRIVGINIVPWALQQAAQLTRNGRFDTAVRYVRGDFRVLPFRDAAFDGIYAIESACHAPGVDKRELLTELHRVLKPGGRVVFADGFLKTSSPMPMGLHQVYTAFCQGWALDTLAHLNEFLRRLEQLGFEAIRVEDVSWRILPSALFIPFAAINLLSREGLFRSRALSLRRRKHLAAPFAVPLFSLFPKRFGYFMVTATKAY